MLYINNKFLIVKDTEVNLFDNSDSTLINKITFEKILKKIKNNSDTIFNFDYLFEEYLLREVNHV